jgi:hypothetical protein
MLSKEDIKEAIEFEDAAAEAGGYVEPMYKLPPYRITDMIKWARANGKDVEKLTPNEREQFAIKPKKQQAL